ncbi:NAD(P)H-binding protein [Enterococcus asini]|uniref:NAD(P)H-binding protein n=1 Tax=Enterococcus asini TaxID=57732 RepID=UPI002890FF28|nr:NAD(P)H-binding protein [Enterococcus asini]MDT2755938.1 NAD(P)H-binding protein [Enterococcus asini]
MNIFVVGATGRVGQMLTEKLTAKGHTVYGASRSAEKIKETELVKPVHFDLHETVAQMAQQIRLMDVIYFVAGSRGKDLLQSDLYGAVKLMQAAEEANVGRYIQLSSLFALEPERWQEDYLANLADYNIAKYFSDKYLIENTDLDYTILQPGSLTEEAGSGHVALQVTDTGKNAIEDVAEVLASLIDFPDTVDQVITMHEGTTPIATALADI